MNAGRLRHVIIIQNKSVAKDAMGQAVVTWTTFATVRAAVEPLSGRMFFDAQKANSEITTRVTIRYRAGISPTWQVKHGDALYQIIEIVNPGMRNIELQLMCKQQPQGVT